MTEIGGSERLDRRRLLGAGIGAGAALALGGGATALARTTAARPGGRALRIGYLPITDASPLLIAHARGLYERFGVRVERPVRFRAWAELAQALVADRVDVVHLLMPFAIQLRYGMMPSLRVVAWNHTGGSALTVHPSVGEVADLAGRTVAIPYWWSVHNVVVQRILRGAGLRPVTRDRPSRAAGTVRLVVMSPSDMLPALDNGVIGGYIVADPFCAAAEARGVGRILRFSGDVWRDHACCVVAMSEELAANRPETVQGVLNAVTQAQLAIRADRAAAAGRLSAGYLPQPPKAIRRALTYPRAPYAARGAVTRPDWAGERIEFAPFPFASYTERLVTEMNRTVVDVDRGFLTGIDPAAVHGELVDDRFVRAAIRLSGGPTAFGLPATLTRTEEVGTG